MKRYDITTQQRDVFEKLIQSVDRDYSPREGDRIFLWSNVKLKKRKFDAYLKQLDKDVKRVTKIDDANVILADKYLSGLTTGTVHRFYNTVKKRNEDIHSYYYSYSLEQYMLRQQHQFDLTKYIRPKRHSWERDHSYDWNLFKQDNGHLFNEILQLKSITDFTASFDVVDAMENKDIFDCNYILKKWKEGLEDESTEEFEELDITAIGDLLMADDQDSCDVALEMLSNFNLKKHYGNLLIIYYCAKRYRYAEGKRKLYTFLKKRLPVKGLLLASNRRASSCYDEGYTFFNDIYHKIADHYPIDKDLMVKLLTQRKR